ncbi:MAG: LptF/LptG family permease [bacterium]|nr:LptF/LptG family permease [bacterium]
MILYRYCAKELVFPLLLSSGVLSAIMLMDQVYKFMPFLQATGLEPGPLVWMVVYSLPTILMLTTPIALMVGVYVGINRLSQDYEVIAMRAAGVSIGSLFGPVLAVAGVSALLVAWLVFWAGPWGTRSLEQLKYDILKKQTKIQLVSSRINNIFGSKSIYVFEKEEELLKGVFIADWDDPEESSLVEAEQGRILFDETRRRVILILYQGRIHQLGENRQHQILDFAQLDYDLAPPRQDNGRLPSRYREKNGPELNDMQMNIGQLLGGIEASAGTRDQFEYRDELHGRIATVLSCLVFGIFALPMGIFDPRNPKTMRFVYMLVMVVLYYSLYAQARAMMASGRGSALMIYFPLLLAVGIGLANFFKINYDFDSFRQWISTRIKNKSSS